MREETLGLVLFLKFCHILLLLNAFFEINIKLLNKGFQCIFRFLLTFNVQHNSVITILGRVYALYCLDINYYCVPILYNTLRIIILFHFQFTCFRSDLEFVSKWCIMLIRLNIIKNVLQYINDVALITLCHFIILSYIMATYVLVR